jgi:hypothetical protein
MESLIVKRLLITAGMLALMALGYFAVSEARAGETPEPENYVLTVEECQQVATEVVKLALEKRDGKPIPREGTTTAAALAVAKWIAEHPANVDFMASAPPVLIAMELMNACVAAQGVTTVPVQH